MPTEGRDAPETDLELRPAVDADAPAVAAVHRAAGAAAGLRADHADLGAAEADFAGLIARSDQEFWIAALARTGTPAGFVGLDGDWVTHLFVHPDHARAGIGSTLLDLVRSLRPQGFALRVDQANAVARGFYRSRGLIELEYTDGQDRPDGAPDLQMAWPGSAPLAYLRGRIDEVDDELAVVLARRIALSGAVQDHKAAAGSPAGRQGRDDTRESEIVTRMAAHVPGLGPERIERIMRVVLHEGLASWDAGRGSARPGDSER